MSLLVVKTLLAASAVFVGIVLSLITLIFMVANGPTLSGLCLLTVPLILFALAIVVPFELVPRRVSVAALAAFLLLDVGYIAYRLLRNVESELRFCENGECDRAMPPLLSRVADEGETARAGLGLAAAFRLIGGAEREQLEALLELGYDELSRSPLEGSPNAVLIDGSPERVRSLVWEPTGCEPLPCLLFLHGFGGQLTLYLQALADTPLGERFIIVAPFLDWQGMWWSDEGEAVVRRTIEEYLPERVIEDQVYLVGLSNGAIGTAVLAQNESIRRSIAGAIMISGSVSPRGRTFEGARGLVITGARDPRFPIDSIRRDVTDMNAAGAEVELVELEGDHFILLSHREAVAESITRWIEG